MKVLRLTLRNYRGTAEREIELAPEGVTIVHGPNEIGKSSLAEALELLLDERDNTTRQRVREVQPVDRDAGAEIEAEIEVGAYRFCYSKRFHQRPETRLAIQSPRVETLSGREAHERVQAILAEHVDLQLWRALRLLQGGSLAQPELAGSASLAEALDRAAGVGGGGEREESLFEAAQQAFLEHFTPKGRARADYSALERAAEQAREAETSIAQELEALERDALAEIESQQRLAEIEAQLAAERAEAQGLTSALEEVRALREASALLDAEHKTAKARLDSAVQRATQRNHLVSTHVGAEAEVESLAEALESEEPAGIAAAAELRHVEEHLESAQRVRSEVAEGTRRARRDAALLRAESELATLRARCDRIAAETDEVARLREILDGPPLDLASVRAIEKAQAAVERAQARLATEGPSVEFDPEVALEVEVDGRRVRLGAGERLEQRISESLLLSVPGIGDLRIVAGAGVAEQRKLLEQAKTGLRNLCMEAGVEDHADALRTLAALRSAGEELARAEPRLAEALGTARRSDLEAQQRALDERASRERASRTGDSPLPQSCDAAERVLEEFEKADAEAREALEDLTRRRDEAARRLDRHQDTHSNTRRRLELAQGNRENQSTRLREAREEVADEELETLRDGCSSAIRELEARVDQTLQSLAKLQPDSLEARHRELGEAVLRLESDLRDERDGLLRLRERLEIEGQRGLFDQLQHAQRESERSEHAWQNRRRRAEAASRLFTTLREERDAARSHYAAPLAQEIRRLGRPLFGPDFDVELDDELRVDRRILAGQNLSEAQLSAGAREQLSLLSRVAAARCAGGVPLWIDDALGHSDAERLDALGPVLAAAAESSQVVVLTCSPERFRSLPAARVVELS